jgi:hypothetical protein
MSKNGRNNEIKFEEALRLLDNGASPERIFEMFPEQKAELRGIRMFIEALKTGKEAVTPGEKLFSEILSAADLHELPEEERVTVYDEMGYTSKDSIKGRIQREGESHTVLEIMQKAKIWIPVGAVVILLLIVGAARFRGSDGVSLTGDDAGERIAATGAGPRSALSISAIQGELDQLERLGLEMESALNDEENLSAVDAAEF